MAEVGGNQDTTCQDELHREMCCVCLGNFVER